MLEQNTWIEEKSFVFFLMTIFQYNHVTDQLRIAIIFIENPFPICTISDSISIRQMNDF